MAGFPSTLTAFTYPTASQRLNSPSHSSIHAEVASAIGNVEAIIGRDGNNSVAGTLLYQIRSADSDGGGHVQAANRGGTGQTAYSKGDVLVATSASALTRLSIGTDGQILAANSSTASGINWISNDVPKVATNASIVTILNATETSVLNVTMPASTLGTSNAIRSHVYIPNWTPAAGVSVLTAVQYGGQTVASIMLTPTGGASASMVGVFRHTMIANNSATLQRHFFEADFLSRTNISNWDNIIFTPGVLLVNTSSIVTINALVSNTSSVNSSSGQTYGMTIRMATTGSDIQVGGYTIEKIS